MATAKTQIGAQLYTLRDHLKTPEAIAATLKKVRAMGYEAVQVSGLGKIEPKELARILDSEGLACAATHVSLDMMKDVAQCVDYHQTLKCTYPAIGGPRLSEPVGAASYHQFAREYSDIARALAARGVFIGYHNHSHELARYEGKTGLEILLAECDKSIWFEIDVYWIAHGGGDPAAWIEKVGASGPKRLPCVHFKDMAITHQREHKMCEVGAGNLNWPRIVDACKKVGVEWYLVERDSGDLDPFESLKISLDNMHAMGLR